MGKFRLPQVSVITLFFFTWTVLTVGYIHADIETDPLKRADELFQSGKYEDALVILNQFINSNKYDRNQLEKVAQAYHLKAKIYEVWGVDSKKEESLKKMYELLRKDVEKEGEETKSEIKERTEEPEKETTVDKANAEKTKKVIQKVTKKPKKKKKFPWLLVAGGVVVLGILIYFLLKNKKSEEEPEEEDEKFTLTVTRYYPWEYGFQGSPEPGTYYYDKNQEVEYYYNNIYGGVIVFTILDFEKRISNSGKLVMDRDHVIQVLGIQKVLNVGGAWFHNMLEHDMDDDWYLFQLQEAATVKIEAVVTLTGIEIGLSKSNEVTFQYETIDHESRSSPGYVSLQKDLRKGFYIAWCQAANFPVGVHSSSYKVRIIKIN